jgi:hypothetical protein
MYFVQCVLFQKIAVKTNLCLNVIPTAWDSLHDLHIGLGVIELKSISVEL